MMKKEKIFWIGLVFTLSLLVVACSGTTPTPQKEDPETSESVFAEQPADVEVEEVPEEPTTRNSNLKMATDFTLPDGNGNMVSLTDELQENEHVVLVFYYGSGCGVCMAQLSEIENDRALYEEMGAQVIAIAIQNEQQASSSSKISSAQFPILAGDKAVAEAYDVYEDLSAGFDVEFGSSTPSVFIINKVQEIVWGKISHIEGSGCGDNRIPSQTILENLL
jgi:peroxiredoxin